MPDSRRLQSIISKGSFYLAAIAQDQDAGIGLILVAPVEIRDDYCCRICPCPGKSRGDRFLPE
jgi:hypothetical protein